MSKVENHTIEIVFATHNTNKVKEVQHMLPNNIHLISLSDLGYKEDIEETGITLEENAWIKANFVFEKYGKACFADDTGLEVATLNGAPGVYSARYAGATKNDNANMDKLLAALDGKTNRNAQFRTAIALRLPESKNLFEGIVTGKIAASKSGSAGFGYDPIFVPEGFNSTFGELEPNIKNSISHRAKAIEKLVLFLSNLADS